MKPCEREQCLMSSRFCMTYCKYNGGKRIPKTKAGFPTAMLREFKEEFWDYRPGIIRAEGEF